MITINKDTCIGCGLCVQDCFPRDIKLENRKAVALNDKCFECGHCVAVCPTNSVVLDGYDMDEVKDLNAIDTGIAPENYLNFMKARRSARSFTSQQLTDEQIEMILDTGRYAPTGGNRQDVAYTVVRESIPEFREAVIDRLKVMGENMLAAGRKASFYSDLWIEVEKEYRETGKDGIFFDAGTVIVISSDDPVSASIAAAHMETMIYAMGLGMLYSGFTRAAIANDEKLAEMLEIKEGYSPQIVLVIGYPKMKYRRTLPRKKADVTWK